MKKIVFAIEQLCGGGAERVTAALANEISNYEDLEVHVITYQRDLAKDYWLQKNVVCHHMNLKVENRIKGIMSRICYLRRTIKEINPCCVVSLATPRMTGLLVGALMNLKIPLILSERNDPSQYPKTRIWRIVRDITYMFSKGVVFQTEDAKKYFSKIIQNKSIVISNPITGKLPERYEGERKKRIVNWCRLDTQKNLMLLIKSFYHVEKIFPQYTLHIFGEGPEKENLQKFICEMGLEGKVFLNGYSTNIYEDVLNAALYVSTSNYEGISNSMLEAIALGIPSVCTDCPVGGAKQTIISGVNGILVPVQDEEALTRAIIKVLSTPELSERMSIEGSKIRDKLNVACIAKQWLSYLATKSVL